MATVAENDRHSYQALDLIATLRESMAVLPSLFKNRNNANAAAVMLNEQLDMVTKALKPVSRAVSANRKRIGKGR